MFSSLLLNSIILLLGSLQLIKSTVLPRSVTCSTGQIVSNATCCQLFPLLSAIQGSLFNGQPCPAIAHEILHLAFHDAIGFSVNGGLGGGADGSILTFNAIEGEFSLNDGLQGIVGVLQPLRSAFSNISDGDLLHFAAVVSVASCPGAPPGMSYFFGRPPARGPASNSSLLSPSDSVSTILDRFIDVGLSPQQVVALLAAHSTAANYVLDATSIGSPFDSTPGIFDTQIFIETLLPGIFPGNGTPGVALSPMLGEIRLESDFLIARDPRTACLWQDLAGNPSLMQSEFQSAMALLQVLGQDVSSLIDCSEVVPVTPPFLSTPHFPAGFGITDIQQACEVSPFPKLPTVPGPPGTISTLSCWGGGGFCWFYSTSTSSPPTSTSSPPTTTSRPLTSTSNSPTSASGSPTSASSPAANTVITAFGIASIPSPTLS